MADLLTHVLVAYVVLTTLGWTVNGITQRWVVVGMGGAALPDLGKVSRLLDDRTVGEVLGVPFSYGPVSTVGGVCLVAGLVALAFRAQHRRRAYAFLLAGGALSLVGDGLRAFPDGSSTTWLYPVTWWRPPTPGLYVSSDPRVLAVVGLLAAVVFVVDRHRRQGTEATVTTRG